MTLLFQFNLFRLKRFAQEVQQQLYRLPQLAERALCHINGSPTQPIHQRVELPLLEQQQQHIPRLAQWLELSIIIVKFLLPATVAEQLHLLPQQLS